jgi:hypothetical protein
MVREVAGRRRCRTTWRLSWCASNDYPRRLLLSAPAIWLIQVLPQQRLWLIHALPTPFHTTATPAELAPAFNLGLLLWRCAHKSEIRYCNDWRMSIMAFFLGCQRSRSPIKLTSWTLQKGSAITLERAKLDNNPDEKTKRPSVIHTAFSRGLSPTA